MARKINWMHYLAIGISTLFVISTSLCSCSRETVERIYTIKYIYTNNTGVDIEMEVYRTKEKRIDLLKKIPLKNNTTVQTHTTEYRVPVFFLFRNLNDQNRLTEADSVIVRFSDNKCSYHLREKLISDDLFHGKRYNKIETGKQKYSYHYTFTRRDDYDKAITCK